MKPCNPGCKLRCPYIDIPMEPDSICPFETFRELMHDTRDFQTPEIGARCFIVISSKEYYGQCALATFTGEFDRETMEAHFTTGQQIFKGRLWCRCPAD